MYQMPQRKNYFLKNDGKLIKILAKMVNLFSNITSLKPLYT